MDPNSLTCTQGPTPNLPDYHRIIGWFSGGKDSQAFGGVLADLARDQNIMSRLVVVHADLPDDWPDAGEYAAMHAERYGYPQFETVRREILDPETGEHVPQGVMDHVLVREKFPDKKRRWCTSDHKTGPGRKLMTRLVREVRESDPEYLGGPVRILSVFGFRAAESLDRRLRLPYRFDTAASNSRRHVDEWSPIHNWPTEKVIEYIDASGIPHHPAYDGDDGTPWAGMSRLSCRFCVLASRRDLTIAVRRDPQGAARIAQIERTVNHRFRQNLSMAELIAASATP